MQTPLILIIDDEEIIHSTARRILGDGYQVVARSTGEEGLAFIERNEPDLILLDIMMIGMDGFEVLKRLRSMAGMSEIPVIFLTGVESEEIEVKCFKAGAWDFVRKPFIAEVLRQRVKHTIALSRLQRSLKTEVTVQTSRVEHLTRQIMMSLSKAVEAKDHYTNGHSERVARYSMEIARRMGKSEEEQEDIYFMGILHDVGKIGVHEDIINKPGKLTDEEFAEIKSHTTTGYEILKTITELPGLSTGARWHHERFDGTGYPDGLVGYAIPEAARIICVADCYDAMTSNRSYSSVRPQQQVRDEIERCKGSQFDPDIADVMLAMIDDDKDYQMREHREEEQYSEDARGKLEKLSHICDLDIEEGIKNNETAEDYLEALEIFCDSIDRKSTEIENYMQEGNIESYTVKVHSLKSLAKLVGAMELSEFAKKLEFAGKDGDIDTINNETGDLLKIYREYKNLFE